MGSTFGNFLRRVADDCDKSCGGVSPEDFEKMQRLQLQDHEDIQRLMDAVVSLKRDADTKKSDKQCKVIKLQ